MSIRDAADYEMERANFAAEDRETFSKILDLFFDAFDSGGAVWAASETLRRLIAGKPLSALTGTDDEWMEIGTDTFQNIRCSTVFKQDGRCYDIDTPGRPTIEFPYWPKEDRVPSPVIDFEI